MNSVPVSVHVKAALLAGLVFSLGVPAVGAALFFPVMLLAGPHSDLLPSPLQSAVVVAGWLSVVGVPAWAALRSHRWFIARQMRARNADRPSGAADAPRTP